MCSDLCQAGWHVITTYRKADGLARLLSHLGPLASVTGVEADVTTDEGCRALEEAARASGEVRALVNLAGGFAAGSFANTSDDIWQQMLRVNLLTAVSATRAAVAAIAAAGGGAVVNVGSALAERPRAGVSAYSVSKAAVSALTVCLAKELAPLNIRVNCVAPDTIDTPENRLAMPDADPSKWVSLQTLAAAIRFLVEDESAGITGAVVPVVAPG